MNGLSHRLRPSFGLVKSMKVGFYALDSTCVGLRSLLNLAATPSMKKTNPKVEVSHELFQKPSESFVEFKMLDDSVVRFNGTHLKLPELWDKMVFVNAEVSKKGIASDAEKQMIKEIDM